MPHFPDMSPYEYGRREDATLNVGWLDVEHPFESSGREDEMLAALWQYCGTIVRPTRGLHECPFCTDPPATQERDGRRLKLGSGEIRVFGVAGEVFAAPNLIYHYVAEHGYRPPAEFRAAVLDGPRPGSVDYQARLARLSVEWQENVAVSGEPTQFRFVRTESGVIREARPAGGGDWARLSPAPRDPSVSGGSEPVGGTTPEQRGRGPRGK